MDKILQADLEQLIVNGRTHTYRGLCDLYCADETQKMQIDRTLQKLRRMGAIKFKRIGKNTIWERVPVAQAVPEGSV